MTEQHTTVINSCNRQRYSEWAREREMCVFCYYLRLCAICETIVEIWKLCAHTNTHARRFDIVSFFLSNSTGYCCYLRVLGVCLCARFFGNCQNSCANQRHVDILCYVILCSTSNTITYSYTQKQTHWDFFLVFSLVWFNTVKSGAIVMTLSSKCSLRGYNDIWIYMYTVDHKTFSRRATAS